jgi:hypothetical protein
MNKCDTISFHFLCINSVKLPRQFLFEGSLKRSETLRNSHETKRNVHANGQNDDRLGTLDSRKFHNVHDQRSETFAK